MATKKDRKTMKRDGAVVAGVDLHKHAELEACQRLLEAGAIGARLYSGPSVTGSFHTRQDVLLREMKWVAVDMFEQRKIAVAQCRIMADMVNKYWSERSRGCLSTAASMVQNYWMSVAKEIRAPIPEGFKQSRAWTQGALFKLNTLQSSFRTMSTTGGTGLNSPRSTNPVPTPTATSFGNADETGPDGKPSSSHGSVSNKRALGHGLAHDWLEEREQVNPPLADSTTGLADFSVQIVKHHLRESQKSGSSTPSRGSTGRQQISPEQHSKQLQLELSSPSFEDESPHMDAASPEKNQTDDTSPGPPPINHKLYTDMFIPIDDFVGEERENSAIEHAINLTLSKYGGANTLKASATKTLAMREGMTLIANFDTDGLEKQRTVLEEILATNIMSRSPQLFSLAASLAAASIDIPPVGRPGGAASAAMLRVTGATRRAPTQASSGAGAPDDSANGTPAIVHKHYFVSVIYSTFSPIGWDHVEDVLLENFVKNVLSSTNSAISVDWDMVANALNWRMKTWIGYDNIRTGFQCQSRYPQLASSGSDSTSSPPSRKKLKGTQSGTNQYGLLLRRSQKFKTSYKVQSSSKSSPSGDVGEILKKLNPFTTASSSAVHTNNTTVRFAVPLDKRGVYSSTRPITNSHSRQFFHEPRSSREMVLVFRGSSSASRDPLVHVYTTSQLVVSGGSRFDSSKLLTVLRASVSGVPLSHQPTPVFNSLPIIDQARQEAVEHSKAIALRVMTNRNRAEIPRRAFAVEEMLRKNTNAASNASVTSDQYISGAVVCPTHPSFNNLPRIAEITIGRLLNSLSPEVPAPSATAPVGVPLSIGTLFNYCAAFRKKYPAIFVSQQKSQKPSMPQLRPGFMMSSGQGNKMMTRQAAAAAAAAAPRPAMHSNSGPSVPSQPTQPRQQQLPQIVSKQLQPSPANLPPETPDPVGVTPITAAALPNSAWIRSSQRSRRSNTNTRGTNSPTNEKTQSGDDPNKMMAAGGPSLYGFHTRTTRGNR